MYRDVIGVSSKIHTRQTCSQGQDVQCFSVRHSIAYRTSIYPMYITAYWLKTLSSDGLFEQGNEQSRSTKGG